MSQRQRFYSIVLIICTLGVTSLRTLFFQVYDYAEAHWLLDYRFGFIKRGLWGAIHHQLGIYESLAFTERYLLIAPIIIWIVLVALLVGVMLDVLRRTKFDPLSVWLMMLIAASPLWLQLAHLLGYFDHLFMLVTLLVIASLMRGWYVLAVVLQIFIMFVHESYLYAGYPLVVLWMMLHWSRLRWHQRGIIFAAPVIAFAALFFMAGSGEAIRLALEEYLRTYPLLEDEDIIEFVPVAITQGFVDWWHVLSGTAFGRIFDPVAWVNVMPIALASFWFTLRGFAEDLPRDVLWLGLPVILAPIASLVIVFDAHRVWSYLIFSALCVIWIAAQKRPYHPQPTRPLVYAMLSGLILLTVGVDSILINQVTTEFTSPALRLPIYAVLCIAQYINLRSAIQQNRRDKVWDD